MVVVVVSEVDAELEPFSILSTVTSVLVLAVEPSSAVLPSIPDGREVDAVFCTAAKSDEEKDDDEDDEDDEDDVALIEADVALMEADVALIEADVETGEGGRKTVIGT